MDPFACMCGQKSLDFGVLSFEPFFRWRTERRPAFTALLIKFFDVNVHDAAWEAHTARLSFWCVALIESVFRCELGPRTLPATAMVE